MSLPSIKQRQNGCPERIGPRLQWHLLLVTLLVVSTGCSGELPTQYGKSKGRSGIQSLNGLGTFRSSFETNGWKTQDVHRLSDRLASLDTIVWTPAILQSFRGESEAIFWFQKWLGEKPRTLIYVLPDEGSELDYWRIMRNSAPPAQRLEYQRRYARALVRWMTASDQSELVDQTWFQARRRRQGTAGWEILPRDTTAESADEAATDPMPTAAEPFKLGPSGVVVPGAWPYVEETIEVGPLQYQRLVVDEDGKTLVMRISWGPVPEEPAPADKTAGRSQILVVAGGSQITNFAMTQPSGQALVQTLIAQSGHGAGEGVRRAGFLYSDYGGVAVSEADERPSTGGGMELLVVWPLSLVTMHVALVGIVVCLILLPIFGRPRRLQQHSQSDFADHIQAVAALMHRSGGEHYARTRISDYMRRVRGETTGKWVLPEQHDAPALQHRTAAGQLAHHLPHKPNVELDDTLGTPPDQNHR